MGKNRNSDLSIDIPNDTQNEPKKHKKRSLLSRILRFILWIILFIVVVIVIYTVYTLFSNYRENKVLDEYDEKHSKKIDINGHKLSYSIAGEINNQTIVLLPGVGSPSPIIELKPLVEALSDKYKIITIEPFGYGFSDDLTTNRTLDSLTYSFRECTKKIGIDHYYVMAHSMGGFYALNWANKYTDEVDGVIGLDPSTYQPEMPFNAEEYDSYYNRLKFLKKIGAFRLHIEGSLDPSYKYSEEEIKIYNYLIINRSFRDGVIQDYYALVDYCLKSFKGIKFPDKTPVLEFLAGETLGTNPGWEKNHYNQLGKNSRNEIIKLDGPHYIHYAQKDTIVKKIKEWIV